MQQTILSLARILLLVTTILITYKGFTTFMKLIDPKTASLKSNESQDVLNLFQLARENDTLFQRLPYMIGHVHMAKTGGTSLNGQLALNYERVCGNKGWSYDNYLVNERVKDETILGNTWFDVTDLFSIKDKKHKSLGKKPRNRGRIPDWIMEETGYHDCDYITDEKPWTFWKQFSNFHNIPMELHIPCRDPVDYLMSQCNHHHKTFNCQNDHKLEKQIRRCLVRRERFDNALLEIENTAVKCYDYKVQFTDYTDYITSILQKKRIQSKYIRRDSNVPRDKENECIWSDPSVYEKVKNILLTYDYYAFCDKCLGSVNDVLYKGSTF